MVWGMSTDVTEEGVASLFTEGFLRSCNRFVSHRPYGVAYQNTFTVIETSIASPLSIHSVQLGVSNLQVFRFTDLTPELCCTNFAYLDLFCFCLGITGTTNVLRHCVRTNVVIEVLAYDAACVS